MRRPEQLESDVAGKLNESEENKNKTIEDHFPGMFLFSSYEAFDPTLDDNPFVSLTSLLQSKKRWHVISSKVNLSIDNLSTVKSSRTVY